LFATNFQLFISCVSNVVNFSILTVSI